MMPDSFQPIFNSHTLTFRGIVRSEFDTDGNLIAYYADGTSETIGPATSYAYAVEQGIAGEGTEYSTFELWFNHIVEMSQAASDAQAWAEGKRGDTDVQDDDPTYHNNSKYYSEEAGTSATNADNHSQTAECWAVGTKQGEPQTSTESTVPGSTNNAKYYSQQAESSKDSAAGFANNASGSASNASTSALNASASATTASEKALVSEGYAVGKQNGTDVEEGDPYYHNNAKYYAAQANSSANNASASALRAENASISSIEFAYAASDNYTDPEEIPSTSWSSDFSSFAVAEAQGKFLWVRSTITLNDDTFYVYTASRVGANAQGGAGAVSSVNGQDGNVWVTAQSIPMYRTVSDDTPIEGPTVYATLQSLINGKVLIYDAKDDESKLQESDETFPEEGQDGVIYIERNTNTLYRWDTTLTTYVSVGSGGSGGGGGGVTYREFTGATSETDGSVGLVKRPMRGQQSSYLRGDASWISFDEALKQGLATTEMQTARYLNENGQWIDPNATTPVIKSTSNRYKYVDFSNGNTSFAKVRADSGDVTNLTSSRIEFVEYSPNTTPNPNHTGYYEKYALPACDSGLIAPNNYDILTTKNPVSIENGGTGAKTAATARDNLGLGSAAVKNVNATTPLTSTSEDLATVKDVCGYAVPLTGGTITGTVIISNTTGSSSISTGALQVRGGLGVGGDIWGARVHNAVWNDYAECRNVGTLEPGYCVTETSSGVMYKTWERLQPGCKMTSDTYGTCMGETDEAQTPIAVAGRVLAYPYRDISEYHLGDAVCSAPDGKIDIMTREEIKEYPERIVGTVSEIPGYDVWYGGTKENPNPVQVNGRIWIYVR